ncbi:hypothetical protein ACYEXS_20300 [Paenibacillus sp. MAH-36]|uniref:Uncharacterized protein n=1 Tax=Paenibacillus violae TaxID=3077234 RepID=A0ABU3RAZ3_9BACL|nr:hypothetical protein [Paenibacillus sp. PFR10]
MEFYERTSAEKLKDIFKKFAIFHFDHMHRIIKFDKNILKGMFGKVICLTNEPLIFPLPRLAVEMIRKSRGDQLVAKSE